MDHSTTTVPSPVDADVAAPGLPIPPKPPGECILSRSCCGNGYGQLRVHGKVRKAHRVVWEQANGPIPPGLVLDHLCRNKACINIDHLELVTNRTNVLRGVGRTAINARKTTCPRGHPLEHNNLCKRSDGTRSCRICHKERDRIFQALKRARIKASREKP
jgi:hypothetical protein